ncbi:red chlorophyll catabolite reductase, chloroplastic [Sesbania bispinosa]|nr:red chlorophyll catabolite reductase, chloroplastic [Sesbania bispinosa]
MAVPVFGVGVNEQQRRVEEKRVFGKEESEGKWEGECGKVRRDIGEREKMHTGE